MFDLDCVVEDEVVADDLEEVVMGLIINSGQARSLAYAALKIAKTGDFEQAKELMAQSRLALNEAHLMTSMLARELVTELIELHEKIK
jgi:PTS system cellobiose-specific IIA component